MESIDISAAWGLLAVAAMGVAVLPWSDREVRESSEAIAAFPLVVRGGAAWAWQGARELVSMRRAAWRALSRPHLLVGAPVS